MQDDGVSATKGDLLRLRVAFGNYVEKKKDVVNAVIGYFGDPTLVELHFRALPDCKPFIELMVSPPPPPP
jgi:hypothetical protein